MIKRVKRILSILGEVSEKAKAINGGLVTFLAVVSGALADDSFGVDEIPMVLTAAIAFGGLVYGVVYGTPNKNFVKTDEDR
jgi:hypothetical protein